MVLPALREWQGANLAFIIASEVRRSGRDGIFDSTDDFATMNMQPGKGGHSTDQCVRGCAIIDHVNSMDKESMEWESRWFYQ